MVKYVSTVVARWFHTWSLPDKSLVGIIYEPLQKRPANSTNMFSRIHGFITRTEAERKLYGSNQVGTFLIRFSDSELGGVTVAWLTGTQSFKTIDGGKGYRYPLSLKVCTHTNLSGIGNIGLLWDHFPIIFKPSGCCHCRGGGHESAEGCHVAAFHPQRLGNPVPCWPTLWLWPNDVPLP